MVGSVDRQCLVNWVDLILSLSDRYCYVYWRWEKSKLEPSDILYSNSNNGLCSVFASLQPSAERVSFVGDPGSGNACGLGRSPHGLGWPVWSFCCTVPASLVVSHQPWPTLHVHKYLFDVVVFLLVVRGELFVHPFAVRVLFLRYTYKEFQEIGGLGEHCNTMTCVHGCVDDSFSCTRRVGVPTSKLGWVKKSVISLRRLVNYQQQH